MTDGRISQRAGLGAAAAIPAALAAATAIACSLAICEASYGGEKEKKKQSDPPMKRGWMD